MTALPFHAKPATVPAAFEKLRPLIESEFTQSTLTFYLNGVRIDLANPNPAWTLLDFIRSRHGHKGTKLGCGEGGCGACTVVLQTWDASRKGPWHTAVNACLYPLVGVVGKHLITIEGLGSVDHPHPLQERIAKLHGSQCGFCTPGIVMSLYALVRNAYDPVSQVFDLSAEQIEMEGVLDGNLCRCTGYKPILQAAKTFVTEDLRGKVKESPAVSVNLDELESDVPYKSEDAVRVPGASSRSCGRPGGCCRDKPLASTADSTDSTESSSEATNSASDAESHTSNELDVTGAEYGKPIRARVRATGPGDEGEGTKTRSSTDVPPPVAKDGHLETNFAAYTPGTELIFPPALRKFVPEPICYGDDKAIWLRPTTVDQVLRIKALDPTSKVVGGSSEVQVEIRFKHSKFVVSIFLGDLPELTATSLPDHEAGINSMTELIVGANTSLTRLEGICADLAQKLGRRGLVLEACRKQLRYFAGRQIRNAASLAGNLATASPISDMNPVLLAAGATVIAKSQEQAEIVLPMVDFFKSYRVTSLPADAIITKIRIPIPSADDRQIFKAYKQAKRKDDDIAIVTAAFSVKLDTEGKVDRISLAYGGMAPMTVLAKKTMAALQGKPWYSPETLDLALKTIGDDFNLPFGVPGGMASYRKTLAMSFVFRFWHTVVSELGLGQVDRDLIEEIHRGLSSGSRDNYNPHEQRVVGKQNRELYGAFVFSPRAHAKIVSIDYSPALGPGLALGYVDHNDLTPEQNMWGSIRKDEPVFAAGKVESHGQVIGLVYAESQLQAQAAARLVKITYEDLPVILTIDEAIAAESFYQHGKQLKKGAAITEDTKKAMDDVFAKCDRIFEGVVRMGGQEHFFLETNCALVIPHSEDGTMDVYSSTQNTMETQEFVSHVTGVPSNRINARVRRLGGGFGGKESRSVPIACALAVAAKKEKRPVRCMLTREEDMMTSGQRHPFQARWKVGVMNDGTLVALDCDLYNNAGFSYDMSAAVMDRACTHVDGCYEIPHAWIRGHVCKTNTHSNTAFRGFGGPQAMFIAESYMIDVAEGLGMSVEELRLKNLYKQGDLTPFLQKIDQDWHIPRLLSLVQKEADIDARAAAIKKFNATHKWKKRGMSGMLPVKFGISFATAVHLNQAAANVKVYADGSILLTHGGTEMGQGLYTKMCQVAAQELKVPLDAIYTQDTATYSTANASPTAASSGSDLNGMAVLDACNQINERLAPYWEKFGPGATMKQVAHAAYLDRVQLSAEGFWKMPRVGYKWGNYDAATVNPMYYYWTQGVGVSEVELDLLTGDHTVLRTDIKMDVGRSINPAIDYGQIEGAFVQGQGLFTMEESLWTQSGQLFTRGPGTYKIPGFSDIPQEFNVSFLQGEDWSPLRTIQSSKGIGEPPVFLGATVLFALKDALVAARKQNGVDEAFVLDSPATAERLRLLVGDDILKMGTVKPKEGERNFLVAVA
ncbi:Xanthine dehydrogenase [Cyphellophora attinorum]|uniref:Xanthine dehydrogenase n=1 Tax=Cyphellophora attinorum TaxID=1664694 RepID=A0A0N1H625_9EURO|nr:Xanthine dehydrogenase [Phialophora attinorum]KPI38037.1 Xanthine dehydrogenase [Phialophora attinorum]